MPSSKQNRSFKYKKNVKSTYTSSQYTNQPARPNVSSVNVGDGEVSVTTSIQRNTVFLNVIGKKIQALVDWSQCQLPSKIHI